MLVRNLPTSNLYQEFGSGRNGLNLNCNPTLSRCITTCYAKKRKKKRKNDVYENENLVGFENCLFFTKKKKKKKKKKNDKKVRF